MQVSNDLKELIEERKFSELVSSLISQYKTAETEQERKNILLDLLKIGQNFPTDLAPVLIKKLEKYKLKRFINEQETDLEKEVSEEIEEEIELDDTIYNEILKTLCQVALQDPEKSVDLIPILIGELSAQNSYETCEKTIETIQSSNPKGCIEVISGNMNKLKNKKLKWRFVLQLGKIGTEHPDLVDQILPILKEIIKSDEDEKVRAAATEAMSLIRIEASDEEIGRQVPVKVLENVSKDKSELVKDIAKEKLDEIKQVEGTEKIISEVKNGIEPEEEKPAPKKSKTDSKLKKGKGKKRKKKSKK